MNNFEDAYSTREYFAEQGILRYYFVSKGKKDIIKIGLSYCAKHNTKVI